MKYSFWRQLAAFATLTLISIFVLSSTAFAKINLNGEFVQGGLVFGKSDKGSKVWFDKRRLRVAPDGSFVFGFNYNHPKTAILIVQEPGKKAQKRTMNVKQRSYDIQRIDGIEDKYVNPPADVHERIKNETMAIVTAKGYSLPHKGFLEEFIWPMKGRITGIFGSQRILNGVPKRPHFGIDIAAPVGTPVKAPASGVVTVAHPDMYYSGGTLLLDHGYGVQSVMMHLNKLNVKKGDRVRKGDVIALSGSTGRSTGPHLDWRVNWFNHRIDAQTLVKGKP